MASLYSRLERADGPQLLGREGEQVAELPGGPDGVLRLPAPVVPVAVGDVGPGGVAGRVGRWGGELGGSSPSANSLPFAMETTEDPECERSSIVVLFLDSEEMWGCGPRRTFRATGSSWDSMRTMGRVKGKCASAAPIAVGSACDRRAKPAAGSRRPRNVYYTSVLMSVRPTRSFPEPGPPMRERRLFLRVRAPRDEHQSKPCQAFPSVRKPDTSATVFGPEPSHRGRPFG